MTPLDFFLWGYVKNEVFATEPASLEDLKERVKASLQNIPRQMLVSAVDAMKDRFLLCIAVDGLHFEHLM